MEIAAKFEGLYHAFTVRHVCKYSELQLAVVSHYKLVALLSDEGFSDLIFVLVQRRLILEVGLPARDSSSFGVEIHAAVDTAFGIWGGLQRLDVSD